MLQTISGVWEISRAKATLRSDVQPFKGHLGVDVESSLNASGVFSVTGTPFKRLTGADRTPLPEDDASELLESELFGHEAGAFTGAEKTHVGHFERADGGTLILDELATITLRMQEKILRVIEYGEMQRVGGSDTLRVDVRIVGSTNSDLLALARDGLFRRDLLDRIAFDVITVPPLRERVEDIMPLAYAFAVNMASELRHALFPGFSHRAASTLLRNNWPGNVRELKNAVERSVYRSDDPETPISKIAFDPFD